VWDQNFFAAHNAYLPPLFSAQLESKQSHCGYEKSIVSDGDIVSNEEKEKKERKRTE
jgi:hypothetical protein